MTKVEQYAIPALITLAITVGVSYYFYQKYQPLVQAANTANGVVSWFGTLEDDASSIWHSITSVWGDPTGTPAQSMD